MSNVRASSLGGRKVLSISLTLALMERIKSKAFHFGAKFCFNIVQEQSFLMMQNDVVLIFTTYNENFMMINKKSNSISHLLCVYIKQINLLKGN